MSEYVIYDLESYPNIFTYCAVDSDGNNIRVYEISDRKNQTEELLQELRNLKINKSTMVGFNNSGYDYNLIHFILEKAIKAKAENKQVKITANQMFKYTQKVIDSYKGDGFGIKVKDDDIIIPQIDLYLINHFNNKAKATSLKMLEFNMRSDNIEDLPYAVGSVLNDNEKDVLIKYNKHDVMQTLKFYNECKDMISFRKDITEKYGFSCHNLDDTKIYFADLESTGLLHHLIEQGDKAKLHNFCAMSVDGKNMWTLHTDTDNERKTLQRFLDRDIILVMHNGIQYDKYALKHFGYNVDKVHFVDTLALSWYLDLYRAKHGLESYGQESGVPKPVIDDWEKLTQADYDNRVKEDVKIQEYTYRKLKGMFEELYGKMSDYEFCTHTVVRYLNFKMQQLAEQQNSKFRVDVEHAKSVIEKLEKEINFKTEQLRQAMPKVAIYAKHKKPAKPYKKDGTLSATGEKWRDIAFEYGYDFNFDGEIKVVKKYDEPNPSSTQQVKDWLFSLGWNPQTFKFVKDTTGERKIPQIYVQGSGGQVCPSIVELSEENPELEHLVGLGVLTHRKGCVQGFLDSVQFGEYVEASANGFTNTLRLKHKKPVVNLPSTRVLYGMDVRACLIAKEGKILGCSDLSSLENRIKFNLQLPYDRDYVYSQMSDTFDPHLEIAKEGGLVTQAEVDFYKIEKEGFDKEKFDSSEELDLLLKLSDDEKEIKIKEISKARGKGKNTNYACQYQAGAKTVARSAGVTLEVGKALHKAYNKVNWSIEKISQAQIQKTVSHGMYQLNPFNNIWYRLKTEKDIFSTLVQGTGSYILDLWLLYQMHIRDNENEGLFNLLATMHDEEIVEVSIGCEDEMKDVIEKALDMVNKTLKVEIPFGCDIQFGHKYSEIH